MATVHMAVSAVMVKIGNENIVLSNYINSALEKRDFTVCMGMRDTRNSFHVHQNTLN